MQPRVIILAAIIISLGVAAGQLIPWYVERAEESAFVKQTERLLRERAVVREVARIEAAAQAKKEALILKQEMARLTSVQAEIDSTQNLPILLAYYRAIVGIFKENADSWTALDRQSADLRDALDRAVAENRTTSDSLKSMNQRTRLGRQLKKLKLDNPEWSLLAKRVTKRRGQKAYFYEAKRNAKLESDETYLADQQKTSLFMLRNLDGDGTKRLARLYTISSYVTKADVRKVVSRIRSRTLAELGEQIDGLDFDLRFEQAISRWAIPSFVRPDVNLSRDRKGNKELQSAPPLCADESFRKLESNVAWCSSRFLDIRLEP